MEQIFMKTDVLIFLATQAVGFAGILIAIYSKITSQLKEFEVRINHVEKQDDAILQKLNEINETVTNIRIELNNKQNKQ